MTTWRLRSWRQATAARPGANERVPAFAVDGFGLLWESRGTLYVTRDGGDHWHAEPSVARPELDFGRGAAAFAGGRGLLLLGRGGSLPARLLSTGDSGRSWRLIHRWG